jgi:hypothetical protein
MFLVGHLHSLLFYPEDGGSFFHEKVGGLFTGLNEDTRHKLKSVRTLKPYFYTLFVIDEELIVFWCSRTKRDPQFDCYIPASDQTGVSKT